MKKTTLIFLFLLTSFFCEAQKKITYPDVEGTWQCTKIEYGDYYEYETKTNTLDIKHPFYVLIFRDSVRYDSDFIESIKSKIAKEAANNKIQLNSNGKYTISGAFPKRGSFELLEPVSSTDNSMSGLISRMAGADAIISFTDSEGQKNKRNIYLEKGTLSLFIRNEVKGKTSASMIVRYTYEKVK